MASKSTSTQPLILEASMVTAKPTDLHVKQKYWSWFKQTGRGFMISSEDGSLLLLVRSQTQGKHRTIEDAGGKPLFKLHRHWTSQSRAWVLRSNESTVLSVKYSAMHRKMAFEVSFENSPDATLQIQASDSAGGNLSVTWGDKSLATLQCTNMTGGYFSTLMIVPPTWLVQVSEGTDLYLAAILTVCVSDAFSEARFLML